MAGRLHQAFRRTCEERLRAHGLSMSQYALPRALAAAPGTAAAEPARRTFVTRQALRGVLAGSEAAGLVRVAARATSGRALPVTLTDEGRALLDRAEATVQDVKARRVADLPGAATERLASLLTAWARNLADGGP
ncbi:MarR family winged helix-turn-helix transcriptional regulator [Streptomyces sp. Da 82-17]|uniref:MarR family winged helix-turn-helix transcriptional regulator n=1 Tax=Streptomyces sp. Da 82-17 TaxID=3377116 RepID=UPI0038D45898